MEIAELLGELGEYKWVLVPVGLFLGLLGYRMYKISLFVIGLFLGLVLGSWIGVQVENSRLGLGLGIVLGLALGAATHFLIRFSLFLAGMAGGFILASVILPQTTVPEGSMEAFLWSLGAALAAGLLTLALYKVLILVMTSLVGTYLIFTGTVHIFLPEIRDWSWILYAVLLMVFIFVQAGWRKNRPDPVEQERRRRR